MAKQVITAQRIAELRAMSYKQYLQTPEWACTRLAVWIRDGKRCRVCNSGQNIQVHHRSYERVGNEPLGDLITLCGDCHQLFHDHRQVEKVKSA